MRFLFFTFLICTIAKAQFNPPQGQAGSTAMYKDSSAFIAWATSSKVKHGLQNISDPSLGYANVGDSTSAIGIADGTVVSLGDSGYAICSFQNEIYDGPGNDFAVFENSFDGLFLELGFVEVSSDGINFFRFPATSNTQDTIQTGTYGDTDATKVNNLAGKYKVLFGTPFDLSQMRGISGLDVNHIKQIKVIDVVGSIISSYATYDINLNKVNDPWPTPFASCGFDLDAVGVINQQINNAIKSENNTQFISVYPNPANQTVYFTLSQNTNESLFVLIHDINGKVILQKNVLIPENNASIDVSQLSSGFYFMQVKSTQICITKKICITR